MAPFLISCLVLWSWCESDDCYSAINPAWLWHYTVKPVAQTFMLCKRKERKRSLVSLMCCRRTWRWMIVKVQVEVCWSEFCHLFFFWQRAVGADGRWQARDLSGWKPHRALGPSGEFHQGHGEIAVLSLFDNRYIKHCALSLQSESVRRNALKSTPLYWKIGTQYCSVFQVHLYHLICGVTLSIADEKFDPVESVEKRSKTI